MELAMANHKLPPLRPVVLDANAPLPVIKRILIASTWRTGSSFVGDLIRSSPGAFYSFEPLHFVDADARIESIPALSRSLRLLQSLYQCRFPADYLRHINGQVSRHLNWFSFQWHCWSGVLPLLPNVLVYQGQFTVWFISNLIQFSVNGLTFP